MLDYLCKWIKYKIKRHELVLEIGSGNNPFIRSNILCDKFPFSSYERAAHSQIVIDRPFVVADAVSLPFKDKSIDFVYSADLAEHLEQPQLFFQECMRVGRRGVLLLPSMLAEQLFGWDFHAVMFSLENDKLIIRPKTNSNRGRFGNLFHEINARDRHFSTFVRKRSNLFRIEYQWQDTINYDYQSTTTDINDLWSRQSSAEHEINAAPSSWQVIKRTIKSLLSLLVRKLFSRY
ncbi:MAG TPA: class I SAM-dependent methyltransferase [bacterium]|nr:class I SAM-dependent methyltransferase [bacterium]HPN45227.1 class I SAM-dependent methyltransferase [bacterium]